MAAQHAPYREGVRPDSGHAGGCDTETERAGAPDKRSTVTWSLVSRRRAGNKLTAERDIVFTPRVDIAKKLIEGYA